MTNRDTKPKGVNRLELLAPAKNIDVARAAIACGADAVYIGADRFGARAAAGNSVSDIALLCDEAHRFDVRIYATLNTLIYEHELRSVETLVGELWRAGVDALIVQDMAMLRLDLPPIALHASTQCDIRTPEKARFLAELGFSQLVLPRELTLEEIAAVRAAIPRDVALEAFIHGALCVSYSGDCQASYAVGGRSANRGECAQICRLPFTLTDGNGRPFDATPRHYLSLRDLNRTDSLADMIEAGISSFKIEGRLKDESYVKNVTAHYRQKLDRIITASDGLYGRTSVGESRFNFTPAPEKSFNRGYTSYFISKPKPGTSMASVLTPKSQGERVGTVERVNPDGSIVARLTATVANGDGMGFFTPNGEFAGFRVNRAEGSRLFPASRVNIAKGTPLYRNSDTAFERDVVKGATRLNKVDISTRTTTQGIAIEMRDERGLSISVGGLTQRPEAAMKSQEGAQERVLAKLGGTDYEAATIDVSGTASLFIPASELTTLRRRAVELLDRTAKVAYRREKRRPERLDAIWPEGATLTRHNNVANSLAEQVYRDHGVTGHIPAAIEVSQSLDNDPVVMTTRYCLRRELNACLRTPRGSNLRAPLTLSTTLPSGAPLNLRLDFDCANCRMRVLKQ